MSINFYKLFFLCCLSLGVSHFVHAQDDPVYSSKSNGSGQLREQLSSDEYNQILQKGGSNAPGGGGNSDYTLRYKNVAGSQTPQDTGKVLRPQFHAIPPSTKSGLSFGQLAKQIKKTDSASASDAPLTFKELSRRIRSASGNAVIKAR